MLALGFRVVGFGFRILGAGFWVYVVGFRVLGLGSGVQPKRGNSCGSKMVANLDPQTWGILGGLGGV